MYGETSFQDIDLNSITGSNYVKGFGIAVSPKGFSHIVTCGLTNVAASRDAFGSVDSGWGYELTVKWPASCQDYSRALVLLNRLAEYMQVRKYRFRAYQVLPLPRIAPALEATNAFAGILFAPDTTLSQMDTVNGHVEFLQIINVTAHELARLKQNRHCAKQLIFNLSKQYPDLEMDLVRSIDYLT